MSYRVLLLVSTLLLVGCKKEEVKHIPQTVETKPHFVKICLDGIYYWTNWTINDNISEAILTPALDKFSKQPQECSE